VTDPFSPGYRFRRDADEEALHRKLVDAMERLARAWRELQKPAPPAKPQ
jgi:hypothetical protein